jgi:DNA-binding MarR family transcriptional regulator
MTANAPQNTNTTALLSKPDGIAYLIGRLDHVLSKRLQDMLTPLGLTVPQYTALSVFRTQGSMSNARLAERTMVSPQSANEMVKTMESKGWIERSPDPSHGRIIHISLTEAGVKLSDACDAKVQELEQAMFKDVSPEQRNNVQATLRAAVRVLKSLE